ELSPRVPPFVKLPIIFGHLPFADASCSDQQNESGRLCDFLRKLLRPGTASPQVRGRKKQARGRILALDGGLEPLRQRLIRRVITEKPARHSSHRVRGRCARGTVFADGLLPATGSLTRSACQVIELPGISLAGMCDILQPVALD